MKRADRRYHLKLTALACPDLSHIWTDTPQTFVVYGYTTRFPEMGHVLHAVLAESGIHAGFADYPLSIRQPTTVRKAESRVIAREFAPELHEYFQELIGLEHLPSRCSGYFRVPRPFWPCRQVSHGQNGRGTRYTFIETALDPRRYPGDHGVMCNPPLGHLIMAKGDDLMDYNFNRMDLHDPVIDLTFCLNDAVRRHLGFAHPTEWGIAESCRHICTRFGFDWIPEAQGFPALADRASPEDWAGFLVEYWKQMPKQVLAWILDTMLLSLSQRPDTTELADLREVLRLAQTEPETCRILDKYLGETHLEAGYRAVLDHIFDSVDIEAVQSTLASARNKGT